MAYGHGNPLGVYQVNEKALDVQVGGQHYKNMTIQPVEFIHANGIGYIEGTIIKYACRWRSKGGIEDLKKIKHFVDLLIELETKDDRKTDPVSDQVKFNVTYKY